MRTGESIGPAPRTGGGALHELRKLGKNLNGYFGETIDIASVLNGCRSMAEGTGWTTEEIEVSSSLNLLAFHRRSGHSPGVRVYISAGIHGDEPAGPLAIRQLLAQNKWPESLNLWVCPCLNPTGFTINRRENIEGADLNRQYLQPRAREIIAHVAWLQRQPRFDLCLCLHEDWESHGFYVYELNPDRLPSLAQEMVRQVAKFCPIDHSTVIDGRPANAGVIRPADDPALRPEWPEAFFLMMHKTRLSYTLESPSDFPLATRITALVTGVETALKEASRMRNQMAAGKV